ncbi:MAG: glycoside hydrolase family 38 C-terminal domain-containing protein [Kiritimatiellae bacterium]|nr:glycoside hydrolase family 38 C-terminal domain-containing protein [Kiritimatiellia bacterium]
MRKRGICFSGWLLGLLLWFGFQGVLFGAVSSSPDPVIHFVSTAHLDTEWRWTVRDTIEKYLPDTVRRNVKLFEKYPDYVFNFEGGLHYQFIRQYYPELFEQVKEWVCAGRWNISGPGLVAFDVNLPAPESLIRSMLYAQSFYEQEFNTNALDLFLPDCFGFSFALPTLARHCGMIGFSTQKLGWHSAAGIPFRIGFWQGVDGSVLPCVLHAEVYTSIIRSDYSQNPDWLNIALETGRACGLPRAYHYYGTGDQGGAPDEASVAWLEGFLTSDGPLKARMSRSQDLFYELAGHSITQQPRYRGELLLTRHGTGAYTSKALAKRWNRQAEQLAAAAEHAAVAAYLYAGEDYPSSLLNKAWLRVLLHHFHDGITGTSNDEVSDMMLNDFQIAQNIFAGVLDHAVTTWSRFLDTRGEGIPVLVYNPLVAERDSLVELRAKNLGGKASAYRVTDPEGREVPSQCLSGTQGVPRILFAAQVPSLSLSAYHIQESEKPYAATNELRISKNILENQRYRVSLNERGEIASIYDKQIGTELLAAPIRLELRSDHPQEWPQWEIDYTELSAPPILFEGTATVSIIESGPVRATLRVEREYAGSTFRDDISLCGAGPVDRIHVHSIMDWHTTGTLLKVAMPFSFGNEKAVYDIGVGTIARPTNSPSLYEVPAQQWVSLHDAVRPMGVAVLNDGKYGWDHPDTNVLRMTVVHAPNDVLIDMGRHEYAYELISQPDGWTNGVRRAASVLNQPLYAFCASSHSGILGRVSSLFSLNDPGIDVLAVKKAERDDIIIVRVTEAVGKVHSNSILRCDLPVNRALDVNGMEQFLDTLPVTNRTVSIPMTPYSLTSLALDVVKAPPRPPDVFNLNRLECRDDVTRVPAGMGEGSSTGRRYFAWNLMRSKITAQGIPHELSRVGDGQADAVGCRGNTLNFNAHDDRYNAVSILAVSMNGDQSAKFRLNDQCYELFVPDFTAPIARGNVPRAGLHPVDETQLRLPPEIKNGRIAEVYDYCVDEAGRIMPYTPTFVFQYILPCSNAPSKLVLPDCPEIKILAATLVSLPDTAHLQTDLPVPDMNRFTVVTPDLNPGAAFIGQTMVSLTSEPRDGAVFYTLDGSRPTRASIPYEGPFFVSTSSVLRAIAFHPDYADEYELKLLLRRHIVLPACSTPPLKRKLDYAIYPGEWSLPLRTSNTVPEIKGHLARLELPGSVPSGHCALKIHGYLQIPDDGIYTFYITSAGACRLYIDGVRIVDHVGSHAQEHSGTVALATGMHAISIDYVKNTDGDRLDIQMAADQQARKPVLEEQLFHARYVWLYSIFDKFGLTSRVRE